ncbi:MAG TPA: DUF1592 domain-containing protein [Polyangia bacterium]|nr:DUF1592 domain-containing protein [Polyangia bacterium]
MKLPFVVTAIVALGCGGRALQMPNGAGGSQAGGSGTATGVGDAGTAGAIGTSGVAGAGGATLPPTLRPFDLARRLSLFLWEAAPDDDLVREVEADPPASRDDVRRLATEMLKDPRARMSVAAFYRMWLDLDRFATVEKPASLFPEYTPALRDDMIAEAEAFAGYVTFDGDGLFPTLLTADFSFLNERLAPIYGVLGVAGPDLRKAALDSTERAGVLTLGAVLANVSNAALPPVTARGRFVGSLLCQGSPAGPPGVPMDPPAPSQTTRAWLAAQMTTAACAACHASMDAVGFAFENYDALGRFSTTELSLTVDPSGSLTPVRGGPALAFKGARGLANLLVGRTEPRDCFVKQWVQFGTGKTLDDSDPSLTQARDAFVASGLDIRALIAAVTTTDAFLTP